MGEGNSKQCEVWEPTCGLGFRVYRAYRAYRAYRVYRFRV